MRKGFSRDGLVHVGGAAVKPCPASVEAAFTCAFGCKPELHQLLGFAALKQMQRVLKPEGKLLFCEHGVAPDENTRRWQRRIGPLWKKIGGGCHLDRDIPLLLQEAGFEIEKMEAAYIKGPKFTAYNYWGVAA